MLATWPSLALGRGAGDSLCDLDEAAAVLVVWLGTAPLGGLGLRGDLAVPGPTQGVPGTRRAAETPVSAPTAIAPGGLMPLATATATTTSTPLPTS